MVLSGVLQGGLSPGCLDDVDTQARSPHVTRKLLILVAAFAVVVAACGDSGGAEVVSLTDSPSDTSAGSDADVATQTDEEALLAFATCMRDNGVEDFEDPIVDEDGGVQFSFGGRGAQDGASLGNDDRDMVQAAFEACQEYIDGIAIAPGGSNFDLFEFEDAFVEFAACMRDQGVPMDDPDFSSFAPGQRGEGGGPFASLDFDDPDVQAALDVCQDVFGGIVPGMGRGLDGGSGGGDA